MKKTIKRILGYSGLGLITVLSSQGYAAGYKLEFQSASVLADAGEAAVVEDAGTNWYNSAGLVYLPQQLVFSGIDVYAPTTFTGTVNAPSTLGIFPPPIGLLGSNFTATGSASSHPNTILPAFHYSYPINDCFAVGMTMSPAWGFTEDYGEGSILRYNATRIYTRTLDLGPSIAMKINRQWSIGFGPDFHYFSVQSKTHVRTEGLAPFGTPTDSFSRFTANRWGYGGHASILFRLDEATRIGLNYRSQIYMNLDGFSSFVLPGGGSIFESNAFKLALPLPPTTTLSVYRDINPCWAVMGTVAFDQWSYVRDYHARNYIQPPTPGNPSGILPDVVQTQDMHNTFDFSVGTHYRLNEKLMMRGSVKYEPTPTQNQYRSVNFPDGAKYGLQIGARYQLNPKMAVDVIYGHVFVRSTHIHDFNPVTFATATGHSNTSIDLIGAQLVWNI